MSRAVRTEGEDLRALLTHVLDLGAGHQWFIVRTECEGRVCILRVGHYLSERFTCAGIPDAQRAVEARRHEALTVEAERDARHRSGVGGLSLVDDRQRVGTPDSQALVDTTG